MNPQDVQEVGPASLLFLKVVEWLNPIVYVVGLSVAIWAFVRCRKRGYFVVGLYFVFVLFSMLGMPSINRAIRAHRPSDISGQTQKKIDEAVRQATDRVLEQEGRPVLAGKKTVHLPFGPIILVAGLWLVARREPRTDWSKRSLQLSEDAPDS